MFANTFSSKLCGCDSVTSQVIPKSVYINSLTVLHLTDVFYSIYNFDKFLTMFLIYQGLLNKIGLNQICSCSVSSAVFCTIISLTLCIRVL